MHPSLHKVAQPVEHYQVEWDPHEGKEYTEETGSHGFWAQVAVA